MKKLLAVLALSFGFCAAALGADTAYQTGSKHSLTGPEALIIGGVITLLALIELCIGKAFAGGFSVDKDKEPVGFWFSVIFQMGLGVGVVSYGVWLLLKGSAQ